MNRIIDGKQFLDPEGRIVESASLLAEEVVKRLATDDVVEVDLRGLRGLPSSYFNVLLQRVLPMTGTSEAFPRRVKIVFESAAQEQVFNRSFEFAKRVVTA